MKVHKNFVGIQELFPDKKTLLVEQIFSKKVQIKAAMFMQTQLQ